MDASGGWFDAGDYLKFVQTTSYTEDLLLAGVRDFPAQMGAGSATSNFTAEAKFGAQWLLKMWNDTTSTLYFQVGIGTGNSKTLGDHDIWRLPQADDTYQGTNSVYRYVRNRPVFRAGAPGSLISPNLAGRDAAAFAECFVVFKTSDPTLANQCITAAQHIFDLANTNPSGNLLTVIPFSFYPETEWRDDLELGATELYFATASGGLPTGLPHTDPAFYLQKAATWANAYITGPNDAADTLNLYDVTGLAHYELYRAITQAGVPSGLAVTQAQLLADLKKQLDTAVAQGGTEPFGFGFPWNTLRHHLARRRPLGHGERVRPAHRDVRVRRLRRPVAREHPGRERLGSVVDRGRRVDVPALHPTSDREPGRQPERRFAGPRRSRRRRTERGRDQRRGQRHDRVSDEWRGRLRSVQRPRGTVPGQHAVLLQHRAGDRPDGVLSARVRPPGRRDPMRGRIGMNRTTRGLTGLVLAALVSASIVASPVTSSAATSPTVVSIQFDDGNANQYLARGILSAYGMHATFYVNSGVIEDGTHLMWSQLTDLAADGNEIASHTLFHTNIKKLKTGPAGRRSAGIE